MSAELHETMRIKIVHAGIHKPEEYRDVLEGHRALKLLDERGTERGELVWRLAHGRSVEITEFGVYDPEDRRKGFGTLLLEGAIADMRAFFEARKLRFRRVYLFCEVWNEPGKAFYEANGFAAAAALKGFYADRRGIHDTVLYVLQAEPAPETA